MNYKIAKTMLVLCVVYLIGFYILKFIFPELLLQTITSPAMLKLGDFLNSWVGFGYIVRYICNFISFYLFACASSGKFKFNKWQFLTIVLAVVVNNIVSEFFPELYTHTSISLMFVIAFICGGKLISATISFVLHGYLSQFLLSIRGFETILQNFGRLSVLSGLLFSFEAYVWLLLLAIIFYIKERKNERLCTPVYQQTQQANGETISESGKERSES